MKPSIGLIAQTACIWEASAPKPGNVHRYRDFENLTYTDFLLSAAAIAPILDGAPNRSIGETILRCVRATRGVISTNSNLGIILLLAPLASVPLGGGLRSGVAKRLEKTTVADTRLVYEAIRLAEPGGLGEVEEQDIRAEPTADLLEVMRLAERRDRIAYQYVHDFEDVFEIVVPRMESTLQQGATIGQAVTDGALHLLARVPDSLIARKHGEHVAEEVRVAAQHLLEKGWHWKEGWSQPVQHFDEMLLTRSLNPGTTADLIAAGLFVVLRARAV